MNMFFSLTKMYLSEPKKVECVRVSVYAFPIESNDTHSFM